MRATSQNRTRQRPAAPRRGVATFFAILLLLIVASTLAVMGMMFAASARRTRALTDEAQLRQLVTAGAIDAARQVEIGDSALTPRTIKVPQDSTDQPASITLSIARVDQEMVATVAAKLGARHLDQRITFQRRDGKWTPVAASLETAPPIAPAGASATPPASSPAH